jgi:hypothetical protein
MSIHQNLFLISKTKTKEFFELARLKPKRFMTVKDRMELERQMERDGKKRVPATIRLVAVEDMDSPGFRKSQKHYKKVWDFVYEHGKQPFKYNWSGAVFCDVFTYLMDEKNICLFENQFCEEDETFQWYVLDSKSRDKYLEALNPRKYSKSKLKSTFEKNQEQAQIEAWAEIKKQLTPEKIKEAEKIFGKERAKEMLLNSMSFPSEGKRCGMELGTSTNILSLSTTTTSS